ncbi:MAG: hypothetical protein IPM84_08295 [Anaerolineae bacterium]|nr:hypothetical protein [Anaerolineae bacterium]
MTDIVTPSARAQATSLALAALTSRPLYLDTETTGLGAGAEIVEVCLLEADGSVLLTSLVRRSGHPGRCRAHPRHQRRRGGPPFTWPELSGRRLPN